MPCGKWLTSLHLLLRLSSLTSVDDPGTARRRWVGVVAVVLWRKADQSGLLKQERGSLSDVCRDGSGSLENLFLKSGLL